MSPATSRPRRSCTGGPPRAGMSRLIVSASSNAIQSAITTIPVSSIATGPVTRSPSHPGQFGVIPQQPCHVRGVVEVTQHGAQLSARMGRWAEQMWVPGLETSLPRRDRRSSPFLAHVPGPLAETTVHVPRPRAAAVGGEHAVRALADRGAPGRLECSADHVPTVAGPARPATGRLGGRPSARHAPRGAGDDDGYGTPAARRLVPCGTRRLGGAARRGRPRATLVGPGNHGVRRARRPRPAGYRGAAARQHPVRHPGLPASSSPTSGTPPVGREPRPTSTRRSTRPGAAHRS